MMFRKPNPQREWRMSRWYPGRFDGDAHKQRMQTKNDVLLMWEEKLLFSAETQFKKKDAVNHVKISK